jgi:HlyD family secretion protein
MADLSEMQVRTLVSETDLGKIQPGMSARVSVEAFPGRTFQGTVTKIEPQAVVEQNVTMFPVLVHLSNRDGALKPGMNAEVIVEVARRDNAVTIPNAAVVGMRDAVAAGALFGVGEDQMRTAPRRPPAAPEGERHGQAPRWPAGQRAQPPTARRTARSGAALQAQPLRRPARSDRAAAAPAARHAAPCRRRMGRGDRGRHGARGGAGGGDVRPASSSCRRPPDRAAQRTAGCERLGHTEVIRGVEPGESVVLISVARLQQQQQDMLNRMRERNSGSVPGRRPAAVARRSADMLLGEIIRVALGAIAANKMRSFLTMLGHHHRHCRGDHDGVAG